MVTEIKPHQIYTTKEAQEFLKVSNSTIKRFLKKGIIKAYRVGGRYRIWGDELLQLVSPELEKKTYRVYRRLKDKTRKAIEKW